MNKKAIVWGYFSKNYGDDLMLKSFINNCKYKHKNICINSYRKYKTYYLNLGVKVVAVDSLLYRIFNRLSIIFKIADPYYHLVNKNTDFIMLGGSLFAESSEESNSSQLKNITYAINHAGCSYVIGSNFGPYSSQQFIKQYHELFKKCDDICFRDTYSCSLFNNASNIRYAPDIIFSGKWESNAQRLNNTNYIVISVINMKNRPLLNKKAKYYEKLMSNIAVYHLKKNENVILTSFCEFEGDMEVCARIKNLCGNSSNIEIASYENFNFCEIIKGAKKIYGTRFHSIILALYYGIECIPFVYNEKTQNALTSYCKSFNSIDLMHLENYTAGNIVKFESQIELLPGIKEKSKEQFEGVNR